MDRRALTDAERSATYYNALAPRYDAELSRLPADILARRAFVDLVTRYVTPDATILDFGCGTGVDAAQYARRGYNVLAYDNSPGMMAGLTTRCADAIATGHVVPRCAAYESFGDILSEWPAPHAVVANFAVLNMIRDLRPWFDALARHLAPPGWVVVSLLNPWHWRQLVRRARWQGVVTRRPDESLVHFTDHFNSYLHFIPTVLRAAPAFRMIGTGNAGTYVRYNTTDRSTSPTWWETDVQSSLPLKRLLWRTPAWRLLGPFMFVVLRRDA
jgi:SAM-dependent methyltransferase